MNWYYNEHSMSWGGRLVDEYGNEEVVCYVYSDGYISVFMDDYEHMIIETGRPENLEELRDEVERAFT